MNCGAQTFPLNIIKKKETAPVPTALYGKIYSKFDNFAIFQNLECEPDTS
jgi:hypothetical protein